MASPPTTTTTISGPAPPSTHPAPPPSARGMPHYDKLRRDLRLSIQRRQSLEERLAKVEAALCSAERQYLEDNAGGNIIKGFDGYVKYMSGGGGGGAGRRKGGFAEADRVFTRSGGAEVGSCSPGPGTPAEEAGYVTPGSAVGDGKMNGGAGAVKKGAVKRGAAGDESETEALEKKKIRVSFGPIGYGGGGGGGGGARK